MAKQTKAARRRAALKGWRNRTKKRTNRARLRNPRTKFETRVEADRFATHIGRHQKAKVVKSGSGYAVVWTKKGYLKNPTGRKVKGGRSVTLHNFTGSIIRKSNGQVKIKGRGRKK
jgi:hypothetical protein